MRSIAVNEESAAPSKNLRYVYTLDEALEAETIVDVSVTARYAGIRFPVVMSKAAWAEFVQWGPKDCHQQIPIQEQDRLLDVLKALFVGIRNRGRQMTGKPLEFEFYRVPRGGLTHRASPTRAKAIMRPMGEDDPRAYIEIVCMDGN